MARPESVRGLPVALVGESDLIGFGRRATLVVTLQTADGALVESLRERLAGTMGETITEPMLRAGRGWKRY